MDAAFKKAADKDVFKIFESDDANLKEKIKQSVEGLKNELKECSDEQDFLKVTDDIKQAIDGSDEDKNEKLPFKPEDLLKLIQNQETMIKELQKVTEQQSEEIKKLKGNIFSKLGKGLLKWGTIAILIGAGAHYICGLIPDIAKSAIKTEI